MRVFLFILPIDRMELGVIYKSLPLHCTLMPWFKLETTPEELICKTNHIFRRYGKVQLVSDTPELFGKEKNIPVYRLAQNPLLINIHLHLWQTLSTIGAEYLDTSYIGSEYTPHVTNKAGFAFRSGRRITITSVQIVEALNTEKLTAKKLVAEIPLL